LHKGDEEMMKPLFAVILISCLFPAACVQPVQYNAKDDSFTRQAADRKAWKTIAVLPFTGDVAYRRVSGEWFSFQIEKLQLFELIGPAVSEVKLGKHGIETTESDIAPETAQEAGRMLGADAVLVGSVKAKELQSPVVRASLIDVASGKVVATSAHSEGMNLMLASSRKLSRDATEDVARDIVDVLYEIAGKPRPHQKKEQGGQEDGQLPWSK
jgi:hypothetical protein